VVVAQLVVWTIPTPEVGVSNTVIGKMYFSNCIAVTKIIVLYSDRKDEKYGSSTCRTPSLRYLLVPKDKTPNFRENCLNCVFHIFASVPEASMLIGDIFNGPFPASLSFIFVFSENYSWKNGLEIVGSDHATNCATTTAPIYIQSFPCILASSKMKKLER